MPKEWYVSFHGGEEESTLNNIHVYSTNEKRLRKALNKKSLPAGIKRRELRGFVCRQCVFEYSQILKFDGTLNAQHHERLCRIKVCRP
jgi:hypothetical protein